MASLQLETCSPAEAPPPVQAPSSAYSSFLALPEELREIIYAHALHRCAAEPIAIHVCVSRAPAPKGDRFLRADYHRKYGRGSTGRHTCSRAVAEVAAAGVVGTPPGLALLFVCREVYTSASKVLYKRVALSFAKTSDLGRFLRAVGPARVRDLRHVVLGPDAVIDRSVPNAAKDLELLGAAVNLHGLHVNHTGLCDRRKENDCERFADALLPLLLAVKVSLQARSTHRSVLDIVRVSEPIVYRCPCICPKVPRERQPRRWGPEMTTKINRIIAGKLGIDFDAEIQKKLQVDRSLIFD